MIGVIRSGRSALFVIIFLCFTITHITSKPAPRYVDDQQCWFHFILTIILTIGLVFSSYALHSVSIVRIKLCKQANWGCRACTGILSRGTEPDTFFSCKCCSL